MQPILKESDFRKELKKEPRLGYLFFGDEDYLKTFAIKLARETLCPDPTYAFFNEFFLDAVDFAPDKLLDALMPMPMMADKKLVVVRGLNFNGIRQGELDELCDVLAHLSEYDYNLLIFHVSADCINPGRLPSKPSATLSALAEYLTPVQFDRCTGTKLTAWMQKHFAHNGVNASAELCSEMSDYCGHSMFVLAGEIDKLSFYARYHQKDIIDWNVVNFCIAFFGRINKEYQNNNNTYKKRTSNTFIPVGKQVHINHKNRKCCQKIAYNSLWLAFPVSCIGLSVILFHYGIYVFSCPCQFFFSRSCVDFNVFICHIKSSFGYF